MTHKITTTALIISLIACSPKATDIAPFAGQASWDAAKQQRWTDFQRAMQNDSNLIIEQNKQHNQEIIRHTTHLSGIEYQFYFNDIEQRRTGDKHALSCRQPYLPDGGNMFTDTTYNTKNCSLPQITAEIFQEMEDESQHHTDRQHPAQRKNQ